MASMIDKSLCEGGQKVSWKKRCIDSELLTGFQNMRVTRSLLTINGISQPD
jgi:hypothetical protein